MTLPIIQRYDRCGRSSRQNHERNRPKIDVIINVQGDEPFIKPEQIDLLKSCFSDKKVSLATLVRKVPPKRIFLILTSQK
jgi:3-deoxy-manno-octulosonate cytidylyltransferase (CMP-KDO synthetase)